MERRLEAVKNSFLDKACNPDNIIRISLSKYSIDTDTDLLFVSDPFKIDKNKILGSKAIRRETDRTQVIPFPDNSHIRNRIIHTNEVVTIANTISEKLGLNVELTEAISLGHDIGHGPFGHIFELALKEENVEFKHENFSGITATFIERNGKGLNLTRETVKGILEHSCKFDDLKTNKNFVSENLVVMYSDKIAYTFSDINDLNRLGHMSNDELKLIESYFPGKRNDRVNECIIALMEESSKKGFISFLESETAQNFKEIRDLMYKNHYLKLNRRTFYDQIKTSIHTLSDIGGLQNYDPILITALMSDNEIKTFCSNIHSYRRINLDSLNNFGVFELIKDGFLENQNYQDLNIRLQQKMIDLEDLV